MAIKVKTKSDLKVEASSLSGMKATFSIPPITGIVPHTPNIIIRAVKIMLMDIRMLIHPKQTKEELEKYSQFADLVYRRK